MHVPAVITGGSTIAAEQHWVVVGLDNGRTSNNATVLWTRVDATSSDRLVENGSFVHEGRQPPSARWLRR